MAKERYRLIGAMMPQSFIEKLDLYCLAYKVSKSSVIRKCLMTNIVEFPEEETLKNIIKGDLQRKWQKFIMETNSYDFEKFRDAELRKISNPFFQSILQKQLNKLK